MEFELISTILNLVTFGVISGIWQLLVNNFNMFQKNILKNINRILERQFFFNIFQYYYTFILYCI